MSDSDNASNTQFADRTSNVGRANIEKIEANKNELKTIETKAIKDENNNITKECNRIKENITTDNEINSMKREMNEHFKETKEKWEITIDSMMIIGKFFEENSDYINVMKTTKKYKQLT